MQTAVSISELGCTPSLVTQARPWHDLGAVDDGEVATRKVHVAELRMEFGDGTRVVS